MLFVEIEMNQSVESSEKLPAASSVTSWGHRALEVIGALADAGEGHGGDGGAVDAGDAEVPRAPGG
jgi:hypothetical protein